MELPPPPPPEDGGGGESDGGVVVAVVFCVYRSDKESTQNMTIKATSNTALVTKRSPDLRLCLFIK